MSISSDAPIQVFKQFFDRVTGIEAGQDLIKRYNFSFQFHVSDGDDFYLEIKDGKFNIGKGDSPEKDVESRTLIEGSSSVFIQLLKGQIVLWDAVWDRKLKAECYGPAQGYISWLSQFLKIGRRDSSFNEFLSD